jgi:hypothetical protein
MMIDQLLKSCGDTFKHFRKFWILSNFSPRLALPERSAQLARRFGSS